MIIAGPWPPREPFPVILPYGHLYCRYMYTPMLKDLKHGLRVLKRALFLFPAKLTFFVPVQTWLDRSSRDVNISGKTQVGKER